MFLLACSDDPPPITDSQPTTVAGTISTVAQVQGGTGGMALAPNGDVLMGDFGSSLSGGTPSAGVYRITPQGDVSLFAEGFVAASGNTATGDGGLFQSDIGANLVTQITPGGEVSTYATGLSSPVGVVMSGTDLVVANCGNNTLSRVAPDGTVSTFSQSALYSCPNGIALASDGNFYVANFSDGQLLRVDPNGEVELFVNLEGGNLGHVTFGNERLYVAMRSAHQIAEVSLDGEVTILAGTGKRGNKDGPNTKATLSFPNDIAISEDGHLLYFNDVHPDEQDDNVISPSLIRVLALP